MTSQSTFQPNPPQITQQHLDYSLSLVKSWFPEESNSLDTYKDEIAQHVLNNTQPETGSALLSVQYVKPATTTTGFTESLATPALSTCLEDWLIAIIDTVMLGFSLAGLKANIPDKVALCKELDVEAVDGLEVALNKFSKAVKAWKAASAGIGDYTDAGTALAKSIFGLLSGIYHMGMLEAIWNYLKNNMTWWDWIKDGLTALCTFLAWFATGGIAFIAECISFVISAISTVQAYYDAEIACPVSTLLADVAQWVESSPESALMHTLEPSICEFNGTMYLFYKNSGSGLNYMTSTDGSTWTATQYVTQVANAMSAPSAVVYGSTIYLFYKGMEDPSLIWYTTSTDGSTWTTPVSLDSSVSTSAAPAAVVFGKKLYVFYMGSGGDPKIWYVSFNGTTWDTLVHIHDGVATSTTPNVTVFGGMLYVFYKGSDSDTRIWSVNTADCNTWGPQNNCNTQVNTDRTPTVILTDNGCSMFYRGSGSNHYIWKVTGNKVNDLLANPCTSTGIAVIDSPVAAQTPSGAAIYYSATARVFDMKLATNL